MMTKPEQPVKTRKGIRSVRDLGPEERMFGGKGTLVRYKPNLTDDSPEKSDTLTTASSQTSPPATAAKKLPDAPTRDQFQSQEEFEEARGYWQSHVGRIKAMVDLARRSKDSPAE
jgi:hypothetical protein